MTRPGHKNSRLAENQTPGVLAATPPGAERTRCAHSHQRSWSLPPEPVSRGRPTQGQVWRVRAARGPVVTWLSHHCAGRNRVSGKAQGSPHPGAGSSRWPWFKTESGGGVSFPLGRRRREGGGKDILPRKR